MITRPNYRPLRKSSTKGESKLDKAKMLGEVYSNPLSPVKHRIVRIGTINNKDLKFEVQSKGADGKWYTIDRPSCEDAAVLLLGRLYGYDLITQ